MTANTQPVLRMVMHAHSDWSYDGSWRLDSLARLFGRLGVNVVLMSEHDDGFSQTRFDDYRAACAAASTPNCLLVPGIEYSDPANDAHILTWGLEAFFGEHRPVSSTLGDVAAAGGVAVFAHPHRRDVWRQYDDRWTPLLAGMEVWNRKTDGVAPGPEAMALARRTGLPPVLGIDFHRFNQLYPLLHHVTLQPDGPANSVLAALLEGRAEPRALGLPLMRDGIWRVGLLRQAARLETFRRSFTRARQAVMRR